MTRDRKARTTSWLLVMTIGLIAGGAWVYYAWRIAGTDGDASLSVTAEINAGAAAPANTRAPSLSGQVPGNSTPTPTNITPMLAEQANTNLNEDKPMTGTSTSQPSRLVTANVPPSRDQVVEITVSGATDLAATPGGRELLSAQQKLARGEWVAARASLTKALKMGLSPRDADYVRGEAARLADAMLFSRAVTPGDSLTERHIVGEGESLNLIARRYKVSEDLLISINKLTNPNRLLMGARLKIIKGPFRAEIDKATHRMDVFLGDILVRSFRVGLGTNGGTPTGTWVVQDKLKNPEWTDPTTGQHYLADDPTNPIGERWLGLQGIEGECVGRLGFGIHGTTDPASIGQNMSMGCVRLAPDDVILVGDLLVVGDSRVQIR